MPTYFHCHQCQRVLRTPDNMHGKSCRCPNCGNVMTIPPGSPAGPLGPPNAVSPEESNHPATSSGVSPNPYSPASSFGGIPNHRSSTVMGLGVASTFVGLFGCACCIVVFPVGLGLGISAVLMGKADLIAMREGRMDPSGQSATQTGVAFGWIGIAFSILSVLFMIVYVFVNRGMFGLGALKPD